MAKQSYVRNTPRTTSVELMRAMPSKASIAQAPKTFDSDNGEAKENCARGLCLLLNVQRMFGISYLGASPPLCPLPYPLRIIIVLWNIVTIGFSYYTFHLSITQTSEHSPRATTKQMNVTTVSSASFPTNETDPFLENSLTPLVNYVRYASMLTYFVFDYLLNIYLGFVARPMFAFISRAFESLLPSEVEYRIGARIALIQLISVLSLTCVFQALLYIHFGQIAWTRWIENMLNLYSLTSTVSLLAYVNYMCGYIIHSSPRNGSPSCLVLYVECLEHVALITGKTTNYLAPAIIVIIVNAAIIDVVSLTLLVSDFPTSYFISIIGIIDFSMIMIALCVVSSHAYDKACETSEAYKQDIYRDELTGETRPGCATRLVMLNTLPHGCFMSPYGLFSLSRSFIVAFFAFVLSYSVILIQTSESTSASCPRH